MPGPIREHGPIASVAVGKVSQHFTGCGHQFDGVARVGEVADERPGNEQTVGIVTQGKSIKIASHQHVSIRGNADYLSAGKVKGYALGQPTFKLDTRQAHVTRAGVMNFDVLEI